MQVSFIAGVTCPLPMTRTPSPGGKGVAPLASHTNRSPNLRFRQRHSPRHSSHVYRDTLMRTAPFSNTRPLRSYTLTLMPGPLLYSRSDITHPHRHEAHTAPNTHTPPLPLETQIHRVCTLALTVAAGGGVGFPVHTPGTWLHTPMLPSAGPHTSTHTACTHAVTLKPVTLTRYPEHHSHTCARITETLSHVHTR